MSFRFGDLHRDEYARDGLTVLRGIIPPALVEDLRREAETARVLARREHGPDAQRLQPVFRYEELDQAVFRTFVELPALHEVVKGIFGEDREEGGVLGVLFEPAEKPWATGWHRDIFFFERPFLSREHLLAHVGDLRMFNQFNAALYDDHSLWVVPGSHARLSTATEEELFPVRAAADAALAPGLEGAATNAERERRLLDYVRRMPGATNVVLNAGDIAFYRNVAWHLGTYVPYVKRATLHSGFYGEQDRAWTEAAFAYAKD